MCFLQGLRVIGPTLMLGALATPAYAVCTFGTPYGSEVSLQTALNGLLTPAPDTVADCLADGTGAGGDAHWVSVSPTSATILLEIAGFASQNRFGLYDSANPGSRVQIFNGANGPGTTAMLTFAPESGGTRVTVTVGSSSWSSSSLFVGEAFGFYLRTPQNNTFYSDSGLNGGLDRMYAYRGGGQTFTGGPIASDGDPSNDVFRATDAILAYEDLAQGDNDYQDFVVLVRGVQPVPLPAAAWLLGSALLGFGAAARGRRLVS